MGYWLKHRLHTEGGVTVGQTYRYKLPVTGFYSAFSFKAETQRDADRNATALVPQLYERITKIEFTSEGTKVIKSLRGKECLALNLFDFGRPNTTQGGESDDSWLHESFYLLAGRSLHDKKWMFDMSKFRDPEISITNTVSSDDGVDMDVSTLQYEIFGWRWIGDPTPSPIGYMRADERLYYDTTGADVEKVVQITTGKRIRRILITGWEPAETIYGHWKNIELQVDEGAYSPVIISNPSEWCRQNVAEYNLSVRTVMEFFLYAVDTSIDCDVRMCYPQHISASPYGAGADSNGRVQDFDSGRADMQCDVAANYTVEAEGNGYMTSLLMGFDKEPDLADLLDTKDMASLKILGTEQESGDTISVVIEEEVLY